MNDRMPCSATVAEILHDDWQRDQAFTDWRIAREHELRSDTGAIQDALSESELYDLAGDFLQIALNERQRDEITPEYHLRTAADVWSKLQSVLDRILDKEGDRWAQEN